MNAVKYDFDAFLTEGNAAPKREQRKENNNDFVRVQPRTDEELHAQEVYGAKKILGLVLFVVLMFSFVLMQVSAGAQNYEIARMIHKTKMEITVEQSENIRLRSELTGITSIYAVDTYATGIYKDNIRIIHPDKIERVIDKEAWILVVAPAAHEAAYEKMIHKHNFVLIKGTECKIFEKG